MRVGKRERLALAQRDALTRARKIKAGLVNETSGIFSGYHSMAFICEHKFSQWGHHQPNSWEYDGKAARRIHSKRK